MRGNVIDMAVGIIIGGAFGKIVSSLVADVLMPPIGLIIGNVNFSELAITLKAATADTPAVLLNYGQFIISIIEFLIIAFSIFIMIRMLNNIARKKSEAPAPAEPQPTVEETLLTEIRDLLKDKN